MQMRQQDGRDANVIVDHLSLGESGFGIEHLVEVRQLKVFAFHVNDSVFWHRSSLAFRNDAACGGKYASGVRGEVMGQSEIVVE